jgi:hypothetical protein
VAKARGVAKEKMVGKVKGVKEVKAARLPLWINSVQS